jgi:hypothetical protein
MNHRSWLAFSPPHMRGCQMHWPEATSVIKKRNLTRLFDNSLNFTLGTPNQAWALLLKRHQPYKESIMGMRVGGSSAAWASQQNNTIGNWQQKQQNVKDLFSALKAGDLEGAKKAIASLDGTAAGAANPTGPFAAISKALQSGDIQGAQAAAQAMPHRGHHHHHEASMTANTNVATSASTATSTTAAVGNTINLTA